MMENFTIVLTSSVLAAGLTSVVNYLIQRNNYKYDYHKKVIDKRMLAYQKLFEVNGMLEIINFSRAGKKSHAFLSSKAMYDTYILNLGKSGFEGIWYSNELSSMMTELNIYLYSKFNDLVESDGDVVDQILSIAEDSYEDVYAFKCKINQQLVSDLLVLHKVEDFLNSKNDKQRESLIGDKLKH
jgi:hypothetical protein